MRKPNWFRRIGRFGAIRLLRRIYRIIHRMPIELQTVSKSRVLVVAPHMDDEVIAPGGTLLLHRQIGSSIGVVFTSDSAGDAAQTGVHSETSYRKQEAQAAAAYVGIEMVRFLDFPDGKLMRNESKIAVRLAEVIREFQPGQIFVPFPSDHHRDHQATSAALSLAIESLKWQGEVWCYEVWSPLWPNVSIDITSVVQGKQAAIACHQSQMKNMNYIEAALGLNRYRGLKVGVEYAESFFVCSDHEYQRITEDLLFQI